MSDPFATAAIRQRVLAGWTAAPVRLREDANAEEDLALGGYRDRLVVELAQNAADAAARAGVPGRLLLRLGSPDGDPVLVAANTGEPLTADGVQSLATLRASAKTGDEASVGRFGVGFAAVLAVTDEPCVLSRSGGVRFSRDDSAALVAEAASTAPALAAEVQRRGGHVPVLRLPFPAEGSPPEGYHTAVVLPLRDGASADTVREQLAAVDDALLLGLPALAEVVVDLDGDRRVLSGAEQRWQVLRREGEWSDAERARLLADRPTEERRQRGWQVLWALPTDAARPPGLLHAPTITDERVSLPALLLASFPLDPTRRHVAAGPLADRIVAECAAAYAELLQARAAAGDEVLALVPTGLAAGLLDGALREAILGRLPTSRILRQVEDGELLRPREAVVLDVDAPTRALQALAPRVAGLVAASRGGRAALRALDVPVIGLADIVEMLPAQGDPPSWRELYEGIAGLADDAFAREALAALPVPLADGRVVRGVRGLLMPAGSVPLSALEPLSQFGLRVVHPAGAHPLLERLGAVPASARQVLHDPATRSAVAEAHDLPGGGALTEAILTLVSLTTGDAGVLAAELPWLRDIELVDDEGESAPAGSLVLPGSIAEGLLDLDEVGVTAAAVVERWPREVLTAVGVLDGLGVVRVDEVDLHDVPEELAELDGFDEFAEQTLDGGRDLIAVSAIRDLDVVRSDRWPEALQHLASERDLRECVITPGYTQWWLRRELELAGTVVSGGDSLGGLLDEAPRWVAELDPQMRRALGVVDPDAGHALPIEMAQRVLAGLIDPSRNLSAVTCLRAWRMLAAADDPDSPAPPAVRVLDGVGSRVVSPGEAVVVDDPRWLQRPDLGGQVVAGAGSAAGLADLLDVDLASERADGAVTSSGTATAVPEAVVMVLPDSPRTWMEHDALTVDGFAVDWWVDDDGLCHAATLDGLARALAWASGRWSVRYALAALLEGAADPLAMASEDLYET